MTDEQELMAAVDQLGVLKAQMADLEARYDAIAEAFKMFGDGKYQGQLFAANVTTVSESRYLDAKTAEAKLRALGVTELWFEENKKTKRGYTMLKLTSR